MRIMVTVNLFRDSFSGISLLHDHTVHVKTKATVGQNSTSNFLRSPLYSDLSPASSHAIGLYRDVWIAAIASSRTSLATLMGVMCNTLQCELRSLCVNSGMLNIIRIVTYYTLPPLESPDSFWIAMAFSR